MRVNILIIDATKDFLEPGRPMYIEGSESSVKSAVNLMKGIPPYCDLNYFIVREAHPAINVEFCSGYCFQDDGRPVPPFTQVRISSKGKDLRDVTGRKVFPSAFMVTPMKKNVLNHFRLLKSLGQEVVTLWPPHCVAGTDGVALQDDIMKVLAQWQIDQRLTPTFLDKGTSIWTHPFSAFSTPGDASVRLDWMNQMLTECDYLLAFGWARSHCFGDSLLDLAQYVPKDILSKVLVPSDCTCDIVGCEAEGERKMEEAKRAGIRVLSSKEILNIPRLVC